MKVISAIRKLKLWPRKKRKKKTLLTHSPAPPPSRPPPPPPAYFPVDSHYEPLLPSAPPLPPWLEYDLQFPLKSEANSVLHNSITDKFKPYCSEISDSQEIIEAEEDSLHDYMVSSPIKYEQSVVPRLEKYERGNGVFGRVVGFGVHIVRCVFPCFHVREVVRLNGETENNACNHADRTHARGPLGTYAQGQPARGPRVTPLFPMN
ncbi:hypothetical protein STAS_32613 [Striga asiatica]|uniref:Uncharacterized protein n=1 Tax=Striga asiatica TaxID=4170 RepID=A0A5A7RC28_STRAF|nr:hypothetical protein STAS_32613 [Striga asiatica]